MSLALHWPQITYLIVNIVFLALGMLDTSKRGGMIFGLLLWVFFTLPILYAGGFFS